MNVSYSETVATYTSLATFSDDESDELSPAPFSALEEYGRTGEPWCGSTSPSTAGNGSLMRLAPIPMAFAKQPVEMLQHAADSSRTTHGALEAVDACRYFAGLWWGESVGASIPKHY